MPNQSMAKWKNANGKRTGEERLPLDIRRIEVLDEAMAEILRRKTPAERLAIGFGLWRSAQKILRGQLASLHPEWDAPRLEREVARRLSHGAV